MVPRMMTEARHCDAVCAQDQVKSGDHIMADKGSEVGVSSAYLLRGICRT